MKRRISRNTVAIWAVVFGLLLSVGPAAVQAEGKWQWHNPLPQGNSLFGVWGSSGSDVTAVGEWGTILNYDGADWNAISSSVTRSFAGWTLPSSTSPTGRGIPSA